MPCGSGTGMPRLDPWRPPCLGGPEREKPILRGKEIPGGWGDSGATGPVAARPFP